MEAKRTAQELQRLRTELRSRAKGLADAHFQIQCAHLPDDRAECVANFRALARELEAALRELRGSVTE